MASPAINSTQSAGGPPQQGGAPGGGSGTQGNVTQDLARLSMDAEKIAGDNPETAPMMRAVQDQVRQATLKIIQMRQAAQQQSPQI